MDGGPIVRASRAGIGDPDHLGWAGRLAARSHRQGTALSAYNLGVRRQTSFDWVGRRLALVGGDDPVVVAGAWRRQGVCGYDLEGQRLWQDDSRSAVQVVTALADGRVAVSYNRGPTRVLQAATGQQLRSLHGVRQVFALTPDASLAVGSSHPPCGVRRLDPSTPPVRLRRVRRSVVERDAGI